MSFFTVEELAKYLKIKPDTIYKKVRNGELPAIKLGKLVRFPKELIDEWIIQQAKKTAEEFKNAKDKVEQKVEETYKKVENEVNSFVERAQSKAEETIDELKKSQENFTKRLKDVFKFSASHDKKTTKPKVNGVKKPKKQVLSKTKKNQGRSSKAKEQSSKKLTKNVGA
jgi:excisionase family DNA binding protein